MKLRYFFGLIIPLSLGLHVLQPLTAAAQQPAPKPHSFPAAGNVPELFHEMEALLETHEAAIAWSRHKPEFSIEKRLITFQSPEGPFQQVVYFIKDHGRYIANYVPGKRPLIDIYASTFKQARDTIAMPPHYHNTTFFGTRLTTVLWYDKWEATGDLHHYHWKNYGDSLVLTERQEWTQKTIGENTNRFCFKYHPQTGYVIDERMHFTLNDPEGIKELVNLLAVDQSNVFPGKAKWDYNIYTPCGSDTFVRFASNLIAADLSDNKGICIRNNGFYALADSGSFSPVLIRHGDATFKNRTCNVWIDTHNKIEIPEKAKAQPFFEKNLRFVYTSMPPAVSDYLINHTHLQRFEGMERVIIKIGQPETFEQQPYPATTLLRGLSKGYWEKDFVIDDQIAYEGNHSLKVPGIPPTDTADFYTNFITTPQVHLQPNSTYRLECMVKVKGKRTKAYISGDTGYISPHEKNPQRKRKTPAIKGSGWQKVQMDIQTPNYDPYIDIRFMVLGPGNAWFDNFILKKVNSTGR